MDDNLAEKKGRCRSMFSLEEEKIIGSFMLSCWNQKLRLPFILLYDVLKKHLDNYPRKNRTKNNRPSNFWRISFFQRYPDIQAVYIAFKEGPYKEYDFVSDDLLNKFVSDLAAAGMVNDAVIQNLDVSTQASSGHVPPNKFAEDANGSGSTQKIKTKKLSPSPRGKLGKKLPDSSAKHKRSKTVEVAELSRAKQKPSIPHGHLGKAKFSSKKNGKAIQGLKLSPNLFSSKNSAKASRKEKVREKPPPLALKTPKETRKKKNSLDSPVQLKRTEVASDSVSLEPIKFEVGANIEAMDGQKWYKAKILEVFRDKKQILIHFNGWGKRFDSIFSMTSTCLRGPTQVDEKKSLMKFNVGDDVLSRWSDGKFYPGTIMNVKETGSYVIMFYDGLKKLVRPHLLKPMTEKEKDAAMKDAQATYLASLGSSLAAASPRHPGVVDEPNFKRYRTSANDREKRVSARRGSVGGGNASATPSRRGRKRKLEQTPTTQTGSTPTPGGRISPSDGGNFQVKQARLDKITHSLLGKAVTTTSPVRGTAAITTTPISVQASPEDTKSPSTNVGLDAEAIDDVSYMSDDSYTPLVIDEDGDHRGDAKSSKLAAKKPLVVPAPESKAGDTFQLRNEGDDNLHQLADAALSYSTPLPEHKPKSSTAGRTTRQEAGEALLRLAHSITDQNKKAVVRQESVPEASQAKSFQMPQGVEAGVNRVMKEGFSVAQAAADLSLNNSELYKAVLDQPGLTVASSEPFLMDTSDEDLIVNWIHDVTDFGWGIGDCHIQDKIKDFLAKENYLVLFGEDSPINFPTENWLKDFLERHPEIFPGREKPLTRFRFDREGFEDWLVRWLAVLRSNAVKPNAVYYCDETMWEANTKLLHDVKFVHKSFDLNAFSEAGNKISTLCCVGADGSAFSPFHVFPDNIGNERISQKAFTEHISFSTRGILSSQHFFHWLKNSFLKGIPTSKRPMALLVDTQLDHLDFAALQFAQENQIVLYRFLPPGAHFIQHPDQKLFGRLRMQWKKMLHSGFMKEHAGTAVSTQTFANYFKQEFLKVATSSTIKMCFELTKLYTPVAEPLQEEQRKERRNKRKNSNPMPYVAPSPKPELSSVTPHSDGGSTRSMPAKNRTPPQRKPAETKALPAAATVQTTSASNLSPPSEKIRTKTKLTTSPKFMIRQMVSQKAKAYHSNSSTAQHPTQSTTRKMRGRPGRKSKVIRRGITRSLRRENQKEIAKVKTVATGQLPQKDAKEGQGPRSSEQQNLTFNPTVKDRYKKGEKIFAKWSDCRLYPATVVKKTDEENYIIRYYDGLTKAVSIDFLRAWNVTTPTDDSAKPLPSTTTTPAITAASQNAKPSTPASTKGQSNLPADARSRIRRGIADKRRHTIGDSPEKIRTRRSSGSLTAKSLIHTRRSRESVHELSFGSSKPSERPRYKAGDMVLCKWTDRRMYQATIIKQIDMDRYLVKYYDSRKKAVHHTWLSPWKPPTQTVQDKASSTTKKKETKNLPELTPNETPAPQISDVTDSSSASTPPSATPPATAVQTIEEKSPVFGVEDAVHNKAETAEEPATETGSIKSRSSKEEATVKPETSSSLTKEDQCISTRKASSDKHAEPVKDEISSNESEEKEKFLEGDNVLARWTDCRSYPATVLKRSEEGTYVIQYYDGMTRTLKKDMLTRWDPKSAPVMKARRIKKKESKSLDTPSSPKEKKTVEKKNDVTSATTKSIGGKPTLAAMKPPKAGYTYESYYARMTRESELSKFKCRAPGCSKVFRSESVLKQHHRHYHQQRYKLRDQEPTVAQKRKAPKEDGAVPAKRKVSSDSQLSSSSSSKPAVSGHGQLPAEKAPRSKGGKPPIDVFRQHQDIPISEITDDAADQQTSVSEKSDQEATEKKETAQKKRPTRSTNHKQHEASSDVKTTPVAKSAAPPPPEDERVKEVEIVNEDVIRCVCGNEDDEGFMLQCDACLTWQHAKCEGIPSPVANADSKTTYYICKICREPPGVRESQKYLYNQDFLTKGALPSLPGSMEEPDKNPEKEMKFQKLMLATHQLMEELNKMQESLHGIRLKIDIVNPDKNHPLLHLWKETNLADDTSIPRGLVESDVAPESPRESHETKKNQVTLEKSHDKDTIESNTNAALAEESSINETIEALITATVRAVSPTQRSDQVRQTAALSTTTIPSVSKEDKQDNGREGTEMLHESTQVEAESAIEKMDVDKQVIKAKKGNSAGNEETQPATQQHTSSVEADLANKTVSLTHPGVEQPPSCVVNKASEIGADDARSSCTGNLWDSIKVVRQKRHSPVRPSRRNRSKSDDTHEEVVVRCRGNLLQHIHHLESCLAERLNQLQDYVSTIENSFDRLSRSSPTSSGLSSPLYDSRLGELQSGLGSLHEDIDAVEKLFSTS